ncbi:hypothetical protein CSAL01_04968 [Colletotrichum salicis]|uniref:Uncharacterized protein n=1 Tax=Colletotrichum salicis TaxID=1209931 RepID=A0A135URS8_9PEZI|nr:hypothetical protein CSAL01_04968 [Colletotrichum salicis]
MAQPNNDEEDYVFPDFTEVPNDERDHSLMTINNPASLMSTGWAMLGNSDSSSDATSEPKDVKASPDRSLPVASNNTTSGSMEKLPKPALTATIPRLPPVMTMSDALRQLLDPSHSTPQPSVPMARKLNSLEHFLAQDFSGGNTESPEAGPSRGSATQGGLNPTGSLRQEVLRPDRISQKGKALANEQYYRQLLRSRSVQSNYRVRDLRNHAGKVPDPEWRWCGFPGCQKYACRHTFLQSWGGAFVVAPIDSGRDCGILKDLLDAFESQRWTYGSELHCRVSFATSPPVRSAVGQFLSRFTGRPGAVAGWDSGDHDAAVEFFTNMRTMHFPVLHSHNIQKIHDEMDKEISNLDHAVPPWRLVLKFIMRLEAWRQHQIGQGYPWDWPIYDAMNMYQVILETYRWSNNKGFSTLKVMVQAEQDKAWTLWWDRHRPWTSCKVAFLSGLEETDKTNGNWGQDENYDGNDVSEARICEGVGQYKPHWWPNRPRAPGFDASLEH